MPGARAEQLAASAQGGEAERLALRLHPHRVGLLTAGLGAFVVAALPLASVARGTLELATWHVTLFAASVPLVFWCLCLAVLASLYHPSEGLVAELARSAWFRNPRARGLLRAYAALSVWAFALAPLVVLAFAATDG